MSDISDADGSVFTARGQPNIAFVKYWGKRDEKLILPYNSSVSMTLDPSVNTTTSVLFSDRLKEDSLYINGERQDLNGGEAKERFAMVEKLRELAKTGKRVLVVSKNNFPTASGIASSASGIATLAFAASSALGLHVPGTELSMIARQGSGSACRSIFGGIVQWRRGENPDGSDSFAEQIVDENYWPELRDILAIASEGKKKVSSRAGMKQTVATSRLYGMRPGIAEEHAKKAIEAVKNKDFGKLAEIVMGDSSNMHATMLDTTPPIVYMNDVSVEILYAITELNISEGRSIAAYTFDAGPNAHIITLEGYEKKVEEALRGVDGIKRILNLRQGAGPRLLEREESLIDEAAMAPKAGI
jgi:diphosphomevalonate decarboxylase